MKDKLIKIMEEYSLTPSEFADKIGVNRASVSHVISGRNNPSIDFLKKIVKTFPSISYQYLIEPECNELNSNIKQASVKVNDVLELDLPKKANEESRVRDEDQAVYSIKAKIVEEPKPEKKVIKIVMFYSDNSFDIFNAN